MANAQLTTQPNGNSVEGVRLESPQQSRRVLVLVLALTYAVGMLVLGGATWSRLYGPSPFHREQAAALLQGHLSVGDSVHALTQNEAWYDGRIQQVWGLGIGLWLAPFEAIYRVFGQKGFPDRLALGIAFVLFAIYSLRTAFAWSRQTGHPILGIGLAGVTLFCPTLLILSRGRHLVYEDTVLYACLVSLCILVAVVRFACFGRRIDFWICAALAALSGLVRPTHAIYGLAGMLACSFIQYSRDRGLKNLVLPNSVLLAGLLVLAGTNRIRFGSPFEFGHRLTVAGGAMVYFTRFDNPYREASLFEASRELFGALFLSKEYVRETSIEDQPGQTLSWGAQVPAVWGQAPRVRWRDMYMSTFDWTHALLVPAGFLAGLAGLRKRWDPGEHVLGGATGRALVPGIVTYSLVSFVGLLAFYLYFPTLSARYLLDCAPAFSGALLLLWVAVAPRWPRLAMILLLGWFGWEIGSAHPGEPHQFLLTQSEANARGVSEPRRRIEDFRGIYNLDNHPDTAGIDFNGREWNADDGMAAAVMTLVLDRPQFVELKVGERISTDSKSGSPDRYRAQIRGVELPLERVEREGDSLHVRFGVPSEVRQRNRPELLFLCFIGGCKPEDQVSKRLLYSVQWR